MRDGMTHAQIAKVLGISRESVRNIERRALWKLKRSGQLDKFLCLLDMEVKEYYGEESRRIKHGEW
jgi:DNA-binding XRE family transcriptional regulator